MTGLLIDTNVLSELRRPMPDPSVIAWWETVPDHLLYVSVLTLGEIRYGVARLRSRDPDSAAAFARWLSELGAYFEDRTLSIDLGIADRWGRLRTMRPIPVVDALLAASAIERDMVLVTRNVRDVEGTGVQVLNPFSH